MLAADPGCRSLAGIACSNTVGGMDDCFCDCCVLSGLGDGPITRSEESYCVWCVWMLSRKLNNKEAWAHWGCRAIEMLRRTR